MSNFNKTPDYTEQQILALVKQHFNLDGLLSELPSYIDLNRKLATSSGQDFVVKIAHIGQSFEEIDFENQVMNRLSNNENQAHSLSIDTPQLIKSVNNEYIVSIADNRDHQCYMRLISFLNGELWADVDTSDLSYAASLGKALAQLDSILLDFEHPASHRYLDWDIRHANILIRKNQSAIAANAPVNLIDNALKIFEAETIPLYPDLPIQIIHNDANDYNLLVNSSNRTVSGLFDFGDMVSTFRIAELAIAAAYAIMGKDNPAEIIKQMALAYHQENALTDNELNALLNFIRIRLAMSICMSSHQYKLNPKNEYLLISQKGAWQALESLNDIDAIAFYLNLKYKCSQLNTHSGYAPQDIIDYRKAHLSENLSLAYENPLKIVQGKGAYLYDHKGSKYLDMVNNVCHVGHCHPRVVAAGQQQMSKLNTNTRYLHDNIINFSKLLLSTMPEELSVCMFVNSGSEANELALRLARNYTQRKAMVVVEGAYHGNANACIEISPYKFDGPGGHGSPEWVEQTLVADPFHGKYRGRHKKTSANYAADVKQAITRLEQKALPLCGFICESIQGVGGQVIHPEGYLKLAYQAVRDAGGVCIADEVQVGMGRVGSHWWAFQTQDVVPDILTIGKPLGNGHPLAAVVTTQAIAKAFENGMEYFNTFGGNPVSCAIGEAVLNAVKNENLMAHALEVGNYLQNGLKTLQEDFPIIGDVRGLGLFIGAEFVNNLETLEPAVDQIDYVIERLKDNGILLTTEGPFHNVLKIKPPIVFSQNDVDYFLITLRIILKEERAGPIKQNK